MKHNDGSVIEGEAFIAIYPLRLVKSDDYEIWQHPYINIDTLESDPDLQLVYFNKDGSVDSYHISQYEYRLNDLNHLCKLQLIFHDTTWEFREHSYLVKDLYSDEPNDYFSEIIENKRKVALKIAWR